MNKLKHTFLMVALVMGTLAFTSCNEDNEVGYDLQGIWEGDFAAVNDSYGDADYTTLQFIYDTDDTTQGNGIETDYYGSYPDRNNFSWRVENGVIYMQFRNSDMDCRISSYRLNGDNFRGTLTTRYDEDFNFNMTRID